MKRRTKTLAWSLAVTLTVTIIAVWLPDVRPWLFLLAFWLTYALIFGSPFIPACVLIGYLIHRVDRGTRRRGFDIMPYKGRHRFDCADDGGTR